MLGRENTLGLPPLVSLALEIAQTFNRALVRVPSRLTHSIKLA